MTTPTPGDRPPCPDAANAVTCQECVEFLLDYLDGSLPPEQRFKFESHLAFCRDCEVFLENYRKAAALTAAAGSDLRARPVEDIPPGLVDAILKARKHGHG